MKSKTSKVYFDTIGWNELYDEAGANLTGTLRGTEYLFSSCNLDEFCLSDDARARSLSDFAWRLSNRKKLLDHVEMTAAEITAHQRGMTLDEPYHDDPAFFEAWSYARCNGVPPHVRAALTAQMADAKRIYRDGMRLTRDMFRPIFQKASAVGFEQDWPRLLQEMSDEGRISEFLVNLLNAEGLLHSVPHPEKIADIHYIELPCTACWLEYYIAVSYVASFESGKLTSPDAGDQIDYRHACYAGLVDQFVTADARMQHILCEKVIHKKAEVITPKEFIKGVTRSSAA